jgi:hypothetical protein
MLPQIFAKDTVYNLKPAFNNNIIAPNFKTVGTPGKSQFWVEGSKLAESSHTIRSWTGYKAPGTTRAGN